jgi:hypothetical protein
MGQSPAPHPSEGIMSKTEFFLSVEADLRLRHIPFDRRQLEEFCRSMAPLADEGDNWTWWADTFLEAMGREPGWRELGQRPTGALYRMGAN